MTSPAQENARMLASILQIGEEHAAERLDRTILVTAAKNAATTRWAAEIIALLERTVRITIDTDVETKPHLELIVGGIKPRADCRRLYADIDAAGATIGFEAAVRGHGEAPGLFAATAACTAAAATLSALIDDPALPTVRFPLTLDFAHLGIPATVLEREINFTGSVLIGAGAVAHGFLRALRNVHARGILPIVDPKTVGEGILNRCLYLTPDDVGLNKAEVLATRAQPDFPQLQITSAVETFKSFAARNGPTATAIVTVDSRRARRSIQSELPGSVLDASTTDVRGVVVHSNLQPNPHACLSCIYRHVPDEHAREQSIADGLGLSLETVKSGFISKEVAVMIAQGHSQINPEAITGMAFDSLFRQLCAEQALATPGGRQVLAPFAFVSSLAGNLLVIELLRCAAGLSSTNYWSVDPWGAPKRQTRMLRRRVPECEFCSRPEVDEIANELWGAGAR
jgi:hypothetical protein